MRNALRIGILSAMFLASGCVSLKVSTAPKHPSMEIGGLVNGYAQFSKVPSIYGTIFEANLLDGRSPGEFVSVDLWALGVGVGVAGARVNLPFFETGIGTLFYQPRPLYEPINAVVEEKTTTVEIKAKTTSP
jgi:hypothetical protein